MHIIAHCGVAVLQRRTEAILEYYLRFQFGNHRLMQRGRKHCK